MFPRSSGEVPSTPTTPMTPGSGDLAMASLSSLTPSLGMISYITTQPAFTPKTSGLLFNNTIGNPIYRGFFLHHKTRDKREFYCIGPFQGDIFIVYVVKLLEGLKHF